MKNANVAVLAKWRDNRENNVTYWKLQTAMEEWVFLLGIFEDIGGG